MSEKALHFDDGKLRLELIPTEMEAAMARGFGYGAKKYPPNNWAKGMEWSRIYASLRRHLMQWYSGIELDEESGLSHLDHAASCLAMLIASRERNIGKDDRPNVKARCSSEESSKGKKKTIRRPKKRLPNLR